MSLDFGCHIRDENFSQYFGLWAIEETHGIQLFDRANGLDLKVHLQSLQREGRDVSRPKATAQAGGIAMIEVEGALTKRGSSLSDAGSMIRIRRELRQAASNPDIGGILLVMDSPGGTVAGTADLASDVARIAESKPVYVLAEDLTASAALWVASQATKFFANNSTALIGSIGTFLGLYDLSGNAAMEGVRPVVISTGGMKGAGFPGTQITPEQVAYFQGIVDKTQREFTASLAAGRKLSQKRVTEMADGRVHVASDALELGLIDGIQSFEQTVEQLQAAVSKKSSPSQRRPQAMSNDNGAVVAHDQPATLQQLKAACSGADANFLMAQLEGNCTVEQARTNWITSQATQLAQAKADAEAARQEAAQAKADAEAARAPKPGVAGLGSGKSKQAESHADPVAAWNEAVQAKVSAGKSKPEAIKATVHEQPELHKAYVASINAN